MAGKKECARKKGLVAAGKRQRAGLKGHKKIPRGFVRIPEHDLPQRLAAWKEALSKEVRGGA